MRIGCVTSLQVTRSGGEIRVVRRIHWFRTCCNHQRGCDWRACPTPYTPPTPALPYANPRRQWGSAHATESVSEKRVAHDGSTKNGSHGVSKPPTAAQHKGSDPSSQHRRLCATPAGIRDRPRGKCRCLRQHDAHTSLRPRTRSLSTLLMFLFLIYLSLSYFPIGYCLCAQLTPGNRQTVGRNRAREPRRSRLANGQVVAGV
jgi:hypothetical protein